MPDTFFQSYEENSKRIIYTPSAFAKANLIHLQEIGQLKAQSIHTSRRNNLISYLFFIVEEGSGILEYEDTIYELTRGDCIFIDCRKSYAHQTSQNLWKLKWVHFYGPNVSNIYQKYEERGGRPCFKTMQPDSYRILYRQLYDIAASDDHIRDMKICEKLTSLLTLLMSESFHPATDFQTSSKRRDLQNIKEYIDLHYQTKITLDELAGTFYINKFYLTRIFREQFGVTISSYLLQVRITHAKKLLRYSDLTIEKIGAECGMSDSNYFARMFKKVEGMSPGEFRRQW